MRMTPTFSASALALLLVVGGPSSVVDAKPATAKKFAFVVTSFNTAVYETKFMEECPDGLAASNDENWWLSTPADVRARVSVNGTLEPVNDIRHNIVSLRGPHGEDVCWNPTSIKDPPLRIVRGKQSYGMNLDGTEDGHPTGNTCAHEKFVGLDGKTRVDNQLYRVLGCVYGWRHHGFMEPNANRERHDTALGVTIVEVTGADGLDTDVPVPVEVSFYRVVDPMPKDAAANIIPYASYRIDDPARYGVTAHGTIDHGILITEPVDIRLPFASNGPVMDIYLRGMRAELRARTDGPPGIEGTLAGYHDLANWWDFIRKIEYLAVVNQFSCPALYKGAQALADGYPDPKTGECTALSSAYTIQGIPAYVIHPENALPREARLMTGRAQ